MNTFDFLNARWGDLLAAFVLIIGVYVSFVGGDKMTGNMLIGAGLLGLRLKTFPNGIRP